MDVNIFLVRNDKSMSINKLKLEAPNDLLHQDIKKGDEIICVESEYDGPGVYIIYLGDKYYITDNAALISVNKVFAKVTQVAVTN